MTTAINLNAAINPALQAVYQSWREGSKRSPTFTYLLPGLTPGAAYTVRLHFAGCHQQIRLPPVQCVINGIMALSNFDVFAAAGGKSKALVQTFMATAATQSGQLAIAFTGLTQNQPAIVNGIEVLQ